MPIRVKSVSKFVKVSPTKAYGIANLVRGKNAVEAADSLSFMPNRAAKEIMKTVKSGIANAYNNFNLPKEDLVIAELRIDKGPAHKRMMPRARGSRDIISKKTSHITVLIESPMDEKQVLDAKRAKEAELKAKLAEENKKAVKEMQEAEKVAEKKETVAKKTTKAEAKDAPKVKDVKTAETKVETAKEVKSEIPHEKPEFKDKEEAKGSSMWGLKSFKEKFFRRKNG